MFFCRYTSTSSLFTSFLHSFYKKRPLSTKNMFFLHYDYDFLKTIFPEETKKDRDLKIKITQHHLMKSRWPCEVQVRSRREWVSLEAMTEKGGAMLNRYVEA